MLSFYSLYVEKVSDQDAETYLDFCRQYTHTIVSKSFLDVIMCYSFLYSLSFNIFLQSPHKFIIIPFPPYRD